MASLDETLAQMQPEDPVEVDFDNYQDAQEFPPPVPRGEYTLIQEKPSDYSIGGENKNALVAILHHKISGGEHDGRRVMYDRVSTKTFDRDGVKVSQAADYLRAVGSDARPRSNAEWGQFFEGSEGKPWKAVLDWEGSCKPCRDAAIARDGNVIPSSERKKWTIKGERNFPMSAAGGRQSANVPCPNCKQPTIEARQSIVRRIPAGS